MLGRYAEAGLPVKVMPGSSRVHSNVGSRPYAPTELGAVLILAKPLPHGHTP